MSTGTIIALSVVILSILMLIVVGAFSYKEIKPTIQNFNNLTAVINQKKNFYTRESKELNERVALLNLEAELMQQEIQEKNLHFQDFTKEQGEFQSSVRYLQNHAADYSKGIATNVKNEIKEDGPKIMKSFKLAFKKTFHKQKIRRKMKKKDE